MVCSYTKEMLILIIENFFLCVMKIAIFKMYKNKLLFKPKKKKDF